MLSLFVQLYATSFESVHDLANEELNDFALAPKCTGLVDRLNNVGRRIGDKSGCQTCIL